MLIFEQLVSRGFMVPDPQLTDEYYCR